MIPAQASPSNVASPVLPATTQADIRRRVGALKRAYMKNAQARVRHHDDPKKWVESELALNDAIIALSAIAASPQSYPAFVQLEGLDTMLHLIQHDNADIVALTMRTLAELCDTEGETNVAPYLALHLQLLKAGAFDATVDAIVQHATPEALRGMENDEGTTHDVLASGLDIFDHAAEMRSDGNLEFATGAIPRLQSLLHSLLSAAKPDKDDDKNSKEKEKKRGIKLRRENTEDPISAAIARVVETLALLLHDSGDTRTAFVKAGGVGTLISVAVMHSNEKGAECVEAAKNALSVLCDVLLGGIDAKQAFVSAGGIDTTIEMIRRKTSLRSSAVKLLDFSCMACQAAVSRAFEKGAVGIVFAAFGKLPEAGKIRQRADVEHILGIMFSMFRYATNEHERNRLLYKFLEDPSKTQKLVAIYRIFVERIGKNIDPGHADFLMDGSGTSSLRDVGDPEEMDRAYLERLDAGLFIAQLAAVIVAHLLAYAPDNKKHPDDIQAEMHNQKVTTQGIVNSVREYVDSIEAADGTDEALKNRTEEQERLRKVVREAQARSSACVPNSARR